MLLEPREPLVDALPAGREQVDEQAEVVDARVALREHVALEALEPAEQLVHQAADLGELAAVFASTHGDLAISDYMCATLAATPALISPIKFHNSVHNAAAGYWSIGTASHAPYTAISAFTHTFGAGLLETTVQVACEQQPVLFVAFDVEAKGALATMAPSRGLLGVALVLAPVAASRPGCRRLTLQVATDVSGDATPPHSAAAALVADNALAPCMPLLEALASDAPATLQLTLGERTALSVQVSAA